MHVGRGAVAGCGGRVTGVMDDPGRASSGVPRTVTKGAASSIGLNKEYMAMHRHRNDEKNIKHCLEEFSFITWIRNICTKYFDYGSLSETQKCLAQGHMGKPEACQHRACNQSPLITGRSEPAAKPFS